MQNKKRVIEIRRVIEYHQFFEKEKPIDVVATLKQFNRHKLIRMATVLSLFYGNLHIPDSKRTLFSNCSQKYIEYLNHCFDIYLEKINCQPGQKVELVTYRTTLELWRHIFAIKAGEYQNIVKDEDAELLLFKVILTLNEKVVYIKGSDKKKFELDELLFLSSFLTNDSNNYNFQSVLQPQLYYFYCFVNAIEKDKMLTAASNTLLKKWSIASWRQYLATFLHIAQETENYRISHQCGTPIFNPDVIQEHDQTGLFSSALVKSLSIEENEFIPYNDTGDENKMQKNVDYRMFRARPIVKLKDNAGYVVINIQLLCERIFNSLCFDFLPLLNGREGSVGVYDFNKEFVEKILFRTTFFRCIPASQFTYPLRDSIAGNEDSHEPDFYFRFRDNLVIVECKAIKMNGEIRDDGDYSRLLEELHEKLVLKTKNLNPTRKEFKRKPEPIGLGQLVYHIDKIDGDEFQWDTNIPEAVVYYPLLVFEDVRLLQPGLLSLLNRWFNELLAAKQELAHISCQPVMAVSINTLFLYDGLIRKKGLTQIINQFVAKCSVVDTHETIRLVEDADFDGYLRMNTFKKENFIGEWLTNEIKTTSKDLYLI